MPTSQASDLTPPSQSILAEVGAVKSLVHELVRQSRRKDAGRRPASLHDDYLTLVQNAVADELADSLVEQVAATLSAAELENPRTVRNQLVSAISAMLPSAGPIRLGSAGRPTVVALVGPTGVGKTTTVAKLAANFSLRENRKVGLITIDTYRIAAVEQLRTYAHIIDLPLEVATSPEELKTAASRLADRDCILIDTAGRGQRDDMKIRELRGFFAVLKPHEVHLVLSSVCAERVLLETVERFSGIGIDRLIFTKLDEAVGFGVVLRCLEKAKAKLSYVTCGQDVPEDIEVGRPERLARLVLARREDELAVQPAGAPGPTGHRRRSC
jgi:flagellar biosynthesis protein FlhF